MIDFIIRETHDLIILGFLISFMVACLIVIRVPRPSNVKERKLWLKNRAAAMGALVGTALLVAVFVGVNAYFNLTEPEEQTWWDEAEIGGTATVGVGSSDNECDPRNQYSFVWNRSTGQFYEENGCLENAGVQISENEVVENG